MKLSKQQIDTLAALHVMEPVTVKGLNQYLGLCAQEGNGGLESLTKLGLVERYKWQPPKQDLTEAQRLGFEDVPPAKLGKRPYLYRLAPQARQVAKFLAAAAAEAEKVLA